MDVRDVIQGGGAGSTSFWIRHVGDNTPHGMVPGGGVSTGRPEEVQVGISRGFWAEVGSTPHWRRRCRRQGLRKCRRIY